MGDGAVRRSGGPGLRTELPDVRPQDTKPGFASVVWGVCGHVGPGDGGDRSPTWRRVPVGAGWSCGIPRGGLGRLCWLVRCRIRAASGRGSARAKMQPHLVEGLDAVLRRLGGTARRWRVDRMATVIVPGTGRIQPSFVGVAKHYGVGVDPCPPRRPNRKGVVEKAIHYLSQRWWRTAVVDSVAQAQDSLDGFCVTVGELADAEQLLALPPMPYPAEGILVRRVAANGLVSVWGNRYSVPPAVIGTEVNIRWRLGDHTLWVVSASGRLVATHRKVPRGQGRVVRLRACIHVCVRWGSLPCGWCESRP